MKRFGKMLLWTVAVVAVLLVVAWFALRRADISYEQLEAKYANAQSEYVDLGDGVRAHVRDQGNPNGPVLVMVHGFSASLDTWEPWVQRLGGDYRIITLDLPGHGLTRTPEGWSPSIEAFADHVHAVTGKLGVSRFTLIGNSMGGNTAWAYALKYPQDLEGLVLVDAGGWPPSKDEDPPLVFKLLANPLARAVLGKLDARPMIRNGLEGAFAPQPELASDAMVTRYAELGRAPGHRDITLALMSDRGRYAIATKEKLAAITTPTLIMHGDTDRLIPVEDGKKFADAIPGSTLIVYEKVGHIPMEQIADRSAADLKAWLETKVIPSAAAS